MKKRAKQRQGKRRKSPGLLFARSLLVVLSVLGVMALAVVVLGTVAYLLGPKDYPPPPPPQIPYSRGRF